MKTYTITWTGSALESLREVYDFVHASSPRAADKVLDSIYGLADSLETFPERYSTEPGLAALEHEYRSVSVWNFKLIYRIDENEVIISKIFDTRRNPKDFKP